VAGLALLMRKALGLRRRVDWPVGEPILPAGRLSRHTRAPVAAGSLCSGTRKSRVRIRALLFAARGLERRAHPGNLPNTRPRGA